MAASLVINLAPDHDQSAFRDAMRIRSDLTTKKVSAAASDLASEQGIPIPEAHYALAREVARSEEMATRALEVVFHLEIALRAGHEVKNCRETLGQIYMAGGDFTSAISHWSKVDGLRPDLRLSYARALIVKGDKEGALKNGRQAKRELGALMQSKPTGSPAEIQWLATLEFLEEFEVGINYLKQQLESDAGSDSSKRSLGRLHLSWFDAQMRGEPFPTRTAFRTLLSSLFYDPGNKESVGRMVDLISTQTTPVAGIEPQTEWIRMLGAAELSAHHHLVFGSAYFQVGRMGEGIHHLEKAHAISPESPEILNNLAWFVAHADPPQLDRALDLANRLTKLFPERLEFRETLGKIHSLRGEWGEARTELESARTVLPDYADLHKTLARVYYELGMEEEAKFSQARFEELDRSRN